MHGVYTSLANVVFIALIVVRKTQEIDCGVAEEGKVYNVDFEIPTGILYDEEIHIEVDRHRIAKCKLQTQTCINSQSDLYNTSLKHFEGRSFVNLLVYNMTYTRARDKDSFQFTSTLASDYERRAICKPLMFWRPRDINCQNRITEEGLYLTCSSQRIYPRGRCLFLVNFNKTKINTHSTSENFEKIAGIPTYFTFNCTLFIPRSTLKPALYYFNLTMYPNIYNNNTDLLYGANVSLSILLDYPKLVLENCPEYTEENDEVQCTCSNRGSNPTDVSIKWYSKDGQAVPSSIQSNVLQVKAKSITHDFYCEATNVLGWKSYSAPYKLKRIFI